MNPTRAAHAWQGFVIWGQWNEPLFDCMLPCTRQTFTRLENLGRQSRNFVTALANVAAYSQRDPWVNGGWLFQFMQEADERHRAQWASDLGRNLEALQAEGPAAVWTRWLSEYWGARITGVPRPLADVEREAMVAWVCPLKSHFASVTECLISAPPTFLDHLTLYRLKQCGLAESNGREIADLLSRLLPRVTELHHDTGELFDLAADALAHGADRARVHLIAGEMLRLGSLDGERLRQLAEDAPDGTSTAQTSTGA